MKTIDPYYLWLGIPPHRRPPTHYDLLGLQPFEEDEDVIDSAGDRQIMHLRTFLVAEHQESAQRLIEQVTEARICLMNVDRRATYNQQIGQQSSAEFRSKGNLFWQPARIQPRTSIP